MLTVPNLCPDGVSVRSDNEYLEPTVGAFDRGDVESYPHNLMRYEGEDTVRTVGL